MMTLYEKIKAIYPQLEDTEFRPVYGSISLFKEGDSEFIAKWEHPTLPRPTDEQLAGAQS
jgi:hypothetical protein